MGRQILFIAILLCGQFAFGQSSVYGKYKGSGMLLDTLIIAFHLDLKQDGNYTMKSSRKDTLVTETGKWQRIGDKIKLKPKYSKAKKKYRPEKTFVLNIEGDSLVWKPNFNMRKFEKEMTKNVGEKVTLVDKSEPLVLYKEN
ncbi:copper resistance protein NlpE N-terminal domain-containing protein [Flavisolibacter ginsengisoli]|jgi:hypothetical protein|uniref:NlpE N-terminal domain-containing protein n=1 Tax=Flavisolibacter ginsengisoli DSM 18119 TaxID=1121884 RepID=A0A1M5GN18_9BACT|nr:copper resistance protein NlpE N-terminal domain-containing protein [Flavisolibacter ginsengisoli]SHG05129.1 NlpE N-terminal domain-containing protein [Flavisolibacter ginsengisoli DSM 18119]